MSNYPPGMTTSDYHHVWGEYECKGCDTYMDVDDLCEDEGRCRYCCSCDEEDIE